MSSWCMGLNAGPAGLPERVRPGAPGCPPVVSGDTNPFSAFAITSASSSLPITLRASTCRARSGLCRFLLPFDYAQGNLEPAEGLRGPAPRGYNGDGECMVGNPPRLPGADT